MKFEKTIASVIIALSILYGCEIISRSIYRAERRASGFEIIKELKVSTPDTINQIKL